MTDVEENGAFLPPEPINPENDEAFKDFTAFTRECLITASEPKSSCCRTSVITGIRLFAKSRKNQFTEKAQELCERLSRVPKKKKGGDLMELFAPVIGYTVSEDENGIRYPDSSGSVCSDCFSSLLKGCFISAGRISSPYHSLNLELSMPNEKVADIMTEALAAHALEPKRTVRRGEILLYYKKAETVGDVLNYMGAFNAYFKLEDALIYREFMKNTNRLTNCDSSNINKTVNAAARQVEAITALASVGMLDALSSGVRETARLRLEHPEVTLEELIQYHPTPITRAGIHRRLQKAVAFAEQRGYI